MALIEAPTRNDLPAYQYTVPLDGVTYQLLFTWNQRINNDEGRWFLQLADVSGNIIVSNVPIISTWPILARFKDSRLPPGILFAFDSSGQNKDPGRFDLGDRVRLFYQEAG